MRNWRCPIPIGLYWLGWGSEGLPEPRLLPFTVSKDQWVKTHESSFMEAWNMQRLCLLGILGILAAASPSAAIAQTITSETAMTFGEMVIGGAGTVTISATANTRNATGSIALVGTQPIARGSVTISHTPGAQVTITVPASVTMTAPSSPLLQPVIQGGSTQTIPAGGILTVFFGGIITFTTGGISGPATCLIPVEVLPL